MSTSPALGIVHARTRLAEQRRAVHAQLLELLPEHYAPSTAELLAAVPTSAALDALDVLDAVLRADLEQHTPRNP